MLGFSPIADTPISALRVEITPPATPATPGGGWRLLPVDNAWWRKRQDEEWVILHG